MKFYQIEIPDEDIELLKRFLPALKTDGDIRKIFQKQIDRLLTDVKLAEGVEDDDNTK